MSCQKLLLSPMRPLLGPYWFCFSKASPFPKEAFDWPTSIQGIEEEIPKIRMWSDEREIELGCFLRSRIRRETGGTKTEHCENPESKDKMESFFPYPEFVSFTRISFEFP